MFPRAASSSILLVPPGQYFCIPLFRDASGCFLMFEFANLGLLFSGANTGYWACCVRRLVLLLIDESSDAWQLGTDSPRATCCFVCRFCSYMCQFYVDMTMLFMNSLKVSISL
jgi:hypothetical protein